jgi:hypothetical protein
MVTFLREHPFWVAVAVAAVAEVAIVYQQWPAPPVKVCASVELGELLAASARTDAQLRDARIRLRTDLNPGTAQELMRLEAEAGKALNAVGDYKKRVQEQQKTSNQACS